MRIGFLGNTNNYPFILARSLRQMGHEVLFLVDSPEILHRPEGRYDDITVPYPTWIRDVSTWRDRYGVFRGAKRKHVVRLLRACDALILNGLGPSLLPEVRRPTVILLTGSDLDFYGHFQTVSKLASLVARKPVFLRRLVRRYVYQRLISAQRSGIRAGIAVIHRVQGLYPFGDALLEEIGVQAEQRVNLLMIDLEQFHPEPLPHQQPVRVLCVTRLTWQQPMLTGIGEMDYKGSDIMIRGVGLFARTTGIPLELRLVKKGLHVAETMRLVEVEGLTNQVKWLAELTQKEVWAEFKQADIIFEQFGSTGFGCSALEAMAMGRPVIMNGRPEVMEPLFGPLPLCQARTPEEVCDQLQRLVCDPAERELVSRTSRKYIEEHFSPEYAAQICVARLSQCL